MTIQGLYLLHKMKQAQLTPNSEIVVQDFPAIVSTANVDLGQRKELELRPTKFWMANLRMTIADLESAEFVDLVTSDYDGTGVYTVTPKGQYILQYFLGALLNSVALPILVSVLTTIITTVLLAA